MLILNTIKLERLGVLSKATQLDSAEVDPRTPAFYHLHFSSQGSQSRCN